MTSIYLPSSSPDDWRRLLADPEKHWRAGYSAHALAHAWDGASGFPTEVRHAIEAVPALAGARLLLALPEHKVALPGGGRPSQNDLWVLARGSEGTISMAVEGKVDEPFDRVVGEWLADASPGKVARLAFLQRCLGLPAPVPHGIRYQLLHRTASALIEAQRFGARQAVMLVHSFSKDNAWFADYAAFAGLFGVEARLGTIQRAHEVEGVALYLGWVTGHPAQGL